jgi:hypothetical protein
MGEDSCHQRHLLLQSAAKTAGYQLKMSEIMVLLIAERQLLCTNEMLIVYFSRHNNKEITVLLTIC